MHLKILLFLIITTSCQLAFAEDSTKYIRNLVISPVELNSQNSNSDEIRNITPYDRWLHCYINFKDLSDDISLSLQAVSKNQKKFFLIKNKIIRKKDRTYKYSNTRNLFWNIDSSDKWILKIFINNKLAKTRPFTIERPDRYLVYKPESFREGGGILISIHSSSINPYDYMDYVSPWADQNGLLVLSPYFPGELWMDKRNKYVTHLEIMKYAKEVAKKYKADIHSLYLYGHSWGAGQAYDFILANPRNVKRAVLSEMGFPTGLVRSKIPDCFLRHEAPENAVWHPEALNNVPVLYLDGDKDESPDGTLLLVNKIHQMGALLEKDNACLFIGKNMTHSGEDSVRIKAKDVAGEFLFPNSKANFSANRLLRCYTITDKINETSGRVHIFVKIDKNFIRALIRDSYHEIKNARIPDDYIVLELKDAGNGWKRCNLTHVFPRGSTKGVYVQLCDDAGNKSELLYDILQ